MLLIVLRFFLADILSQAFEQLNSDLRQDQVAIGYVSYPHFLFALVLT